MIAGAEQALLSSGAGLSIAVAAALGLVYGLSACTLACLPWLGPVLLAAGDGPTSAWRRLLPFSLGRITGYAALGGFAALLGGAARGTFGPWPGLIMGSAAIFLGVYLFRHAGGKNTAPACKQYCTGLSDAKQRGPLNIQQDEVMSSGLFLLGAGMALNPGCPSLALVLITAATGGSTVQGMLLGTGFGLGASAGPFLAFGFIFAHLGRALLNTADSWRRILQRTAAVLLILAGTGTIWF